MQATTGGDRNQRGLLQKWLQEFSCATSTCIIGPSDSNNIVETPATNMKNVDEDERNILVVVAHPDDEALWAGEFLYDNGPKTHLVVTNGKSKEEASAEM